ncbi:MAG: FtsX-like permease family protein [Terriglobales bacterium]
MTLTQFAMRNTWRNKRRSLLSILSLGFSFLLLTFMITIWRSLYIDPWTAKGALRMVCRHRVSFFVPMPGYYREKIRTVPNVANVVPLNRFDGMYKDEHSFIQIGTDPGEFLNVYQEYDLAADQVTAWQQDPTGAIVDSGLARRMGWKLGDRVVIQGVKFPLELALTIRGIFRSALPVPVLYFNWNYVETKIRRGGDEVFLISADSIDHVSRISLAIDGMFRNSPAPTRTEAEQVFDMDAVAMFGNVKGFILSISLAVLFATLMASATTVAMSIRERTAEVAVLRTMGLVPKTIAALFVGEAVTLCLVSWLLAGIAAYGLVHVIVYSAAPLAVFLKIKPIAMAASLVLAVTLGVLSAIIPAYRASRMNIVQGLRHVH